MNMQISIVTLYIVDVTEAQVQNTFNVGSVKMKLEWAFLFELGFGQIKTKKFMLIKESMKRRQDVMKKFY